MMSSWSKGSVPEPPGAYAPGEDDANSEKDALSSRMSTRSRSRCRRCDWPAARWQLMKQSDESSMTKPAPRRGEHERSLTETECQRERRRTGQDRALVAVATSHARLDRDVRDVSQPTDLAGLDKDDAEQLRQADEGESARRPSLRRLGTE